jgi:hypothetical protein
MLPKHRSNRLGGTEGWVKNRIWVFKDVSVRNNGIIKVIMVEIGGEVNRQMQS